MMIRFVIASAALLSLLACSPEDGNRRLDADFGPKPLFDPVVLPSSLTGSAILPAPIDLLFGSEPGTDANPDNDADGTLAPAGALAGIPGWGLADGWSTTATLFFNVQGKVDVENAGDGIRIFDSRRAVELIPGEDYTVTLSPVSTLSPRLVVHWLKPLQESTRYLVGITTDLRSPDGGAALVNELFAALRSETPLSEQTTNSLLAILSSRAPEKIPVLQRIQTAYLAPVIGGLQQLAHVSANSRGAIAREDLVLAWSFTTQSITPTLKAIDAAAGARFLQVGATGLNLGQALSGNPAQPVPLPPGSNPSIYVGAFNLPYYHAAGAENINTSVWANDGTITPGAVHPGTGVPCNMLLRPTSTTLCYAIPAERSTQTVPVVLSRPEGTMPAAGWPTVVFLHGITGDRSQMLAIAGTLASAGFVTIAIDQPLHGLAPGHPLRVPGTTERTFDANLDGDETVDPSGAYFINLSSPMTSRDNIRQSVSDQIHLVRSLAGIVGLGNGGAETINTNRVHFLGHSLGGIVGGTLLGVNADIKAATLAMPGGGIAKLLDASQRFGPVVAAGLQAVGVNKGTDTYEMFLRFAQLAIDPADPINWAASAASERAVQLIEVSNDTVVPNTATDTTLVIIPGLLSGTEPLALAMGLPLVAVSTPVDPPQLLGGSQWLKFDAGNHGSILQPTTANPAEDPVFVEMQRQTANFLASNGACLPLGSNCPQP